VAQAIPTYAMSCFDLTKGLCDELNSLIGKWWWNQNDKENKIHWLSWDKLSQKRMGIWALGTCIYSIWLCWQGRHGGF
jgi:hypothetical protein